MVSCSIRASSVDTSPGHMPDLQLSTLNDAAWQLEVRIMTAAEGLTVLRTRLSPQAVPTQCDHEDESWRYTSSSRSPISAIVQSTVTVICALNVFR